MPPRHQRPTRSSSSSRGAQSTGAMNPSLASIDAKMKLLGQRMKILENNLQVMGRTLVAHNKKMKELESLAGSGSGKTPDLTALKTSIKEELALEMTDSGNILPPLSNEAQFTKRDSQQLHELNKMLESVRQEVNELKYVVDSINPLEYVTLDQLNDVIDRKFERMKKL